MGLARHWDTVEGRQPTPRSSVFASWGMRRAPSASRAAQPRKPPGSACIATFSASRSSRIAWPSANVGRHPPPDVNSGSLTEERHDTSSTYVFAVSNSTWSSNVRVQSLLLTDRR